MRHGGVFVTHDVFARGGGLGVTPARIYEALSTVPTSTANLAAAANVRRRSAQRALAGLADRGLAVNGLGGWTRGPASVDEVAERRGSAGAGADLKERHRQERIALRGFEVTATGSLLFTIKQSTPGMVCAGRTHSGAPCQAWSQPSTGFCIRHPPSSRPPLPTAAITVLEPDPDEVWVAELEEELVYQYEMGHYGAEADHG